MLMLPSALLLAVSPVEAPPATALRSVVRETTTQAVALPYLLPAGPTVGEATQAAPPSLAQPDTSATPMSATSPPVPSVNQPSVSPEAAGPAATPPAEPARPNEIVIAGRRETAGDPLSAVNAESFAITQKVDDAVVGPAARTYKEAVPSPLRKAIHNFLYNLREPIVFLNFMLQLKPGKAAETVGRFAINSTVGAAGLMDIAKRKPFHLPRRSNGFANTLGYYGAPNGPFLFLPIVGPTTVRDLLGGAIDRLVLPVGVGSPFTSLTYTVPAGVLGALDHRSEFDKTLKDLHDNSPDPYAATRAFYLNRRQAEIDQLRGRATGDPTGMSGPPPSVRPFVPEALAPATPPVPSPEASDTRD